jgi:hypothetical protein
MNIWQGALVDKKVPMLDVIRIISDLILWTLVNGFTLGQTLTDSINQMLPLTDCIDSKKALDIVKILIPLPE